MTPSKQDGLGSKREDIHSADEARKAIERWAVTYAEEGVPELILIALLRESADDIERLGYISRQEV